MEKMIFFLVLLNVVGLSLAALDIPQHMEAPLKQMRKACIARTGVDEKYIEQSKNGNLPDVPELRCYILCLMEHSSIIDDASNIDFTNIFHLFPPTTKASFQDAQRDCGTIHGDTRCDTAWQTIKCFFTKYPEGAELP